jgi:hypothetical protein
MIGKQGLVVLMLFALLAGGLWCIRIALRWKWRTVRRARNGCVVPGEVVELEVVGGSPDEPEIVTWVQFRDGRGAGHRIRSGWASSPPPYKIGEAVRVSYEADDPRGAEIVQENQSIVLLALLGSTLAVIATLLLISILVQGVTVQ